MGLLYLFLQQGVNPTSLKALLVALAYWWGLALAIYLMGHGLVAVPRRLVRNASPTRRLRRIQESAPKIHERLEDSTYVLEQLEAQVIQLRRRKSGMPRDLQDWVEQLADTSLASGNRSSNPIGLVSVPVGHVPTIPAVVSERFLADLTRRLVRARHKKARFVDSWDRLVDEAVETQAIVDSAASKSLDFGRPNPERTFWSRITLFTPYTRHLFYYRLTPAFRYFLGLLLSLASVCIIWSETTKIISSKLSIISLTILSHPFRPEQVQLGFGGQAVSAVWLLYMCAAALTSINDAKVWGNRALVRRNTYGECMLVRQPSGETYGSAGL